jgi:hypothetical protein
MNIHRSWSVPSVTISSRRTLLFYIPNLLPTCCLFQFILKSCKWISTKGTAAHTHVWRKGSGVSVPFRIINSPWFVSILVECVCLFCAKYTKLNKAPRAMLGSAVISRYPASTILIDKYAPGSPPYLVRILITIYPSIVSTLIIITVEALVLVQLIFLGVNYITRFWRVFCMLTGYWGPGQVFTRCPR